MITTGDIKQGIYDVLVSIAGIQNVQTNRVWSDDFDDLYSLVNTDNTIEHWEIRIATIDADKKAGSVSTTYGIEIVGLYGMSADSTSAAVFEDRIDRIVRKFCRLDSIIDKVDTIEAPSLRGIETSAYTAYGNAIPVHACKIAMTLRTHNTNEEIDAWLTSLT